MAKHKRLWDFYRFPGVYAGHTISSVFGDPHASCTRFIQFLNEIFLEDQEKINFSIFYAAIVFSGILTEGMGQINGENRVLLSLFQSKLQILEGSIGYSQIMRYLRVKDYPLDLPAFR